MITLTDLWVERDGSLVTDGDATEIDQLLARELKHLADADGGWRKLYRHSREETLWQLDYPQSEKHGGGPRRLQQLDITDPAAWE